jgi:hypothetical protein
MNENIKNKINIIALNDTNSYNITNYVQINLKTKKITILQHTNILNDILTNTLRDIPNQNLITVLPPSKKDYAEVTNIITDSSCPYPQEIYKIFGVTINSITDIIILLQKPGIEKFIIMYEISTIDTIDFINRIYFYNRDRNRNLYTIKLSQTISTNNSTDNSTNNEDDTNGSLFDSEVLNLYDIIITNTYTSTTSKDILISIIEKMISFQ